MDEPIELAARYVAVWVEPDATRRRAAIHDLWAKDGVHLLQPPREIQDAGAALGLVATLEARGHEALERRVRQAYEAFVAPGVQTFRLRDAPARLGDVVTLTWEMVPTHGGEATAIGLDVLLLDGDGRILADHQFIQR